MDRRRRSCCCGLEFASSCSSGWATAGALEAAAASSLAWLVGWWWIEACGKRAEGRVKGAEVVGNDGRESRTLCRLVTAGRSLLVLLPPSSAPSLSSPKDTAPISSGSSFLAGRVGVARLRAGRCGGDGAALRGQDHPVHYQLKASTRSPFFHPESLGSYLRLLSFSWSLWKSSSSRRRASSIAAFASSIAFLTRYFRDRIRRLA